MPRFIAHDLQHESRSCCEIKWNAEAGCGHPGEILKTLRNITSNQARQ